MKYEKIKWKENGKLKLLIIVGTRPEIIRLSAVINKTRKYFDVILYAGIFLVIAGFVYSIMKLDNIKIGETVIIGGIANMLLSCVL